MRDVPSFTEATRSATSEDKRLRGKICDRHRRPSEHIESTGYNGAGFGLGVSASPGRASIWDLRKIGLHQPDGSGAPCRRHLSRRSVQYDASSVPFWGNWARQQQLLPNNKLFELWAELNPDTSIDGQWDSCAVVMAGKIPGGDGSDARPRRLLRERALATDVSNALSLAESDSPRGPRLSRPLANT